MQSSCGCRATQALLANERNDMALNTELLVNQLREAHDFESADDHNTLYLQAAEVIEELAAKVEGNRSEAEGGSSLAEAVSEAGYNLPKEPAPSQRSVGRALHLADEASRIPPIAGDSGTTAHLKLLEALVHSNVAIAEALHLHSLINLSKNIPYQLVDVSDAAAAKVLELIGDELGHDPKNVRPF